MARFLDQDCPLCGTLAEYGWVDNHNSKYFNCPSCGYFQISKRAEKVLATKPLEMRRAYAMQVPQAPANHLFVIRMPDHQHRQSSNDELQASFVDKSEIATTMR